MKTLILAVIRCSLMFTAVAAFSLAHPVKANLITNGGFETGDFTGWTPSDVPVGEFEFPPHSGNFQAFSEGGTLSQTLASIPGQTYFVSFWLATVVFPFDVNLFEVTWGGEVEIHLVNQFAFIPYRHFTFSVEATSASTELQFAFFHSEGHSLLDDVSVTPVGVPDAGSTFPLLGLALLGLLAYRRQLLRGQP